MGTRSWIVEYTRWQSILTMKRLKVQLIIRFSSNLTSSLINCTKLNIPSQKVIEYREPISVGLFILQYAKIRMLELYYNFFKKFCDTEKYEELEMDTDSLCLALSEENLEVIILPEKRNEWEAIPSQDCTDSFTLNTTGNFFPWTCCTAHKKHDKREPGLFEEEFRFSGMLCLCSKTYCCYDRKSNNTNSVARDSVKEPWKTVKMDPCRSIAKC